MVGRFVARPHQALNGETIASSALVTAILRLHIDGKCSLAKLIVRGYFNSNVIHIVRFDMIVW